MAWSAAFADSALSHRPLTAAAVAALAAAAGCSMIHTRPHHSEGSTDAEYVIEFTEASGKNPLMEMLIQVSVIHLPLTAHCFRLWLQSEASRTAAAFAHLYLCWLVS